MSGTSYRLDETHVKVGTEWEDANCETVKSFYSYRLQLTARWVGMTVGIYHFNNGIAKDASDSTPNASEYILKVFVS